MKHILFFIFIFITTTTFILGQELNCQVQVASQQVQATDKQIFQNMQKDIFEFMNNTKWTNHVFNIEERIECSFLINITSWDMTDKFEGTIQITARRPVFNSSYNTVLINFIDKDFEFRYSDYTPLEFSETTHKSNLTSVLAFYAYVILGLDYDTFSKNGGTEFYQKAENIVNNAQSDPNAKGWKAFEGNKNRYWLVENILNPTFAPLRECLYQYHLLGLDKMHKQVNTGRTSVLDALYKLEKVHSQKPTAFLLQLFFQAKSDEIVNIFSESFQQEKVKAANLLKKIDPANSSKYNNILK